MSESQGAEIRAFLIADIRGYTVFTNERGDDAAGRLAAKFARVVISRFRNTRNQRVQSHR